MCGRLKLKRQSSKAISVRFISPGAINGLSPVAPRWSRLRLAGMLFGSRAEPRRAARCRKQVGKMSLYIGLAEINAD
jgi:hypothetical protein